MSILIAVMVAIAIWHFTIWLPDFWWGGIIGAFFMAILGGVICSFLVNGLAVSGTDDVNILNLLEAVPGTLLALGASWIIGKNQLRNKEI